MQITAILSSPLFTWLSRRPGRNDKYHDFVSEKPIHPFSANRDHHHFKKTKNKVLPFILSKFGHESTRWFMSYSKKMVSPSIEKKNCYFLGWLQKKVHKNKRIGCSHGKPCLHFERERYRKTHFTLFPADNINSAKTFSLQNREWVLIYSIIKYIVFFSFLFLISKQQQFQKYLNLNIRT